MSFCRRTELGSTPIVPLKFISSMTHRILKTRERDGTRGQASRTGTFLRETLWPIKQLAFCVLNFWIMKLYLLLPSLPFPLCTPGWPWIYPRVSDSWKLGLLVYYSSNFLFKYNLLTMEDTFSIRFFHKLCIVLSPIYSIYFPVHSPISVTGNL